MRIELLVFDGCPNHGPVEKLVRESVEELRIDADIEIINVVDNDDAVARRFLGSPSIRIDGKDIEITEDESTEYSMRCRRYKNGDTMDGCPPKGLLVSALKMAQQHENS